MRNTTLLAAAAALVLLLNAPALAAPYVGGGTFVARDASLTGSVVDQGGVVCDAETGRGVGGACVPFHGVARGVHVLDRAMGNAVAFQVCVDNNGDGVCGGTTPTDPCPDQIFFSHSDGGAFFNPLGPLPQGFLRGCPGGYPGWVVMLCEGVHAAEIGGPHAHPATAGTVTPALDGSGAGEGNFCGGGGAGGRNGIVVAEPKPYVIN